MPYDKKREYLIKTLSRTKRKDYENYIINAIWHKLGRLDIQPVTQQYVKRTDGKYALIDLYFPQINVGIECDEEFHISNEEHDKKREITMKEMLASYDETADFKLYRIRAYESIESIEEQINSVVTEIQEIIDSKKIKVWDINREPFSIVIEKGTLEVQDNLSFRTIVEITKCFGKKYKAMQHAYFNLGNGYYIWCPKLAIIVDGSATAVSKGWVKELSNDWSRIYESNTDHDAIIKEKHLEISRITFAKSMDALGRDVYRFIGVFKYSKDESTSKRSVYRRIAQKIDI
ncbi:AbaSI family restriction endonuclease [Clostridium sp.]|uniref:AbaSI family restriction endonuclease n=1 Tax=Clostridium sp. TaxID=1506 RepID=UPI001A4E5018|nr:hypothetical protein [Clostridium sp.]MBK5242616.1 hypothetical protein [Clostridium sp.]